MVNFIQKIFKLFAILIVCRVAGCLKPNEFCILPAEVYNEARCGHYECGKQIFVQQTKKMESILWLDCFFVFKHKSIIKRSAETYYVSYQTSKILQTKSM